MASSDTPVLSIVVVIVSDTTDTRCDASHLAGCLEALARQQGAPATEIIVPHLPCVAGITKLTRRFPAVRFMAVDDLHTFRGPGGSREHHDELRARGLGVARGKIVGLLEDHARPDEHWCARMVEAHQQPFAAVGGAIENGIDRPLNWAVYFCDFGKYQNPVPAGESLYASDANVAYKRSTLESIQTVWQESFQETAVNWALRARGEKLALSPWAVVYQHRSDLRLIQALKERFVWGRSYAASRGQALSRGRRLMLAALAPVLPAVLLARMARNVVQKRRCVAPFARSFPLTALLTLSWSWGELIGYLTGRAGPTDAGRAEAAPGPARSFATQHQRATS